MRVVAAIACLLMWPIYLGQVVSVINLPLARRMGLQEPAETIDPVYVRDTAGTARWDVVAMWVLPLAGVFMLADASWWPYLALIGGAVYIDTGGRQGVKLVGYRRERVRVGPEPAVRLAFAVYAIFVIVGALAIGAALAEVAPT